MRHRVPPIGKDGKRWYGYRNSVPEDPARCPVEVYGFHSSHQCNAKKKPGTDRCGRHAEAPDDRITMFYVGFGYQFRGAPERGGIHAVEVAKLTDARVQLPNGSWDKIESRSGRYFVDRDAAIAHVRKRHVSHLENARRSVIEYERILAEFNALYPEV